MAIKCLNVLQYVYILVMQIVMVTEHNDKLYTHNMKLKYNNYNTHEIFIYFKICNEDTPRKNLTQW
jgi:hypothetical protein